MSLVGPSNFELTLDCLLRLPPEAPSPLYDGDSSPSQRSTAPPLKSPTGNSTSEWYNTPTIVVCATVAPSLGWSAQQRFFV
jgi:hypothetical protein